MLLSEIIFTRLPINLRCYSGGSEVKDKLILYFLTVAGFTMLPFALKKEPKKDWIIVFLLKTLISGFLGNIIAAKQLLTFPVRLLPKAFKSSVIYDNLLFPLMCVFYNQTTYKSKPGGMILQALLYSLPMTGIEYILEKRTNLIKYIKWKWYYTLFSLIGTFLLVRAIIGYIRVLTRTERMNTNESFERGGIIGKKD